MLARARRRKRVGGCRCRAPQRALATGGRCAQHRQGDMSGKCRCELLSADECGRHRPRHRPHLVRCRGVREEGSQREDRLSVRHSPERDILQRCTRPDGKHGRRPSMAYCGDDDKAKQVATTLISDVGFGTGRRRTPPNRAVLGALRAVDGTAGVRRRRRAGDRVTDSNDSRDEFNRVRGSMCMNNHRDHLFVSTMSGRGGRCRR